MIIWGSKGCEKVVDQGQFHCPRCDEPRSYTHKRVSNYFTLYFIPLFPTSTLGEYVECYSCGETYKPEVLSYRPPSASERLVHTADVYLNEGLPMHMVMQKLIALGADQPVAQQACLAASGDLVHQCDDCKFAFKNTIKNCLNCGKILRPLNARATHIEVNSDAEHPRLL